MIPQRWQIHLTAIYGSREEDQGAPRRGGVRLPFCLIAAAIPLISQLMIGVTFTSIRLVTASNHSVLQPLRLVRLPMWRLAAVPNRPVLQPTPPSKAKTGCLVTEPNHSVLQPLRTVPRARRRFRHLNRMKNAGIPASATQDGVSHPMRISADVNSRPNDGTACFSSQPI